jgi:O-acetyl-ADP-ribose deacetylase (regulator of RNase III)
MTDELRVNGKVIRLIKGFIIDMKDVDGIVFYARPDLALGSGFGAAIAAQGGAKIQEELKKLGSANVTDVVVTGAGDLKAKYLLHAVGPRFQEENMEEKLRATMRNTLGKAEEYKISKIAFPAMGAGFYGIPMDSCARASLDVVKDFLAQGNIVQEVVFCLRDSREYTPFQEHLRKMK